MNNNFFIVLFFIKLIKIYLRNPIVLLFFNKKMKPNVNQTLGFSPYKQINPHKSIRNSFNKAAYLHIRYEIYFGFKKNEYFFIACFILQKIIAI
jgi:hypothetical protein